MQNKSLATIFKTNLYRIRKEELNISYGKLGKLSKVDPSTISLIEKGLRIPSLDTVDKLAKGLGLNVDILLKEKDIRDGDK
ncbi:helix-turn-helix transcriptional regulator [Rummeliibacillus stabekisii]|uniref:helix-turn-helix domain-containing protein n=1 Tax=Rummeliibacillus stabekisii TaxID=241244 RepID=UPI00203BEA14|nr:helix-turn-helix transcriptional regulator [Rummeliibacillus stabekisii]MCM3317328.1 helix-turn-helix transcriptional regulator [Rummeliibacillus stabekisii]